jgi:UDP-3-O-[3-hydroxymyristoyl] N-acetylglucosamine deacetylase
MRPVRTDHGVCITNGQGLEIDLVEHFLAALGGLGIRGGVLATIEGPELPLLDGGARTFAEALSDLEVPGAAARLIVAQRARFENGASVYDLEMGDGVEIEVETDFAHADIARQMASWSGDPRAFLDDIAPARTFGLAGDAERLWRAGRAGLASRAAQGDPAAAAAFARGVLVLGEHVALHGEPSKPLPDELAKHKLLDLVGDLALYGGPPRGRIRALRPGHTATHRMVKDALQRGILRRDIDAPEGLRR